MSNIQSRLDYHKERVFSIQRRGTAVMWELADALTDAHYELGEVFWQADWGWEESTLRNWMSVSRAFPPSVRPQHLSISHCVAVQGMPEEQRFAIIAHADALADKGEKVTVRGMKKMRQELEGTVLPPETSWDEMRRELVYSEGLLRRCAELLRQSLPYIVGRLDVDVTDALEEVEAWLLNK